jgi:hypothetical protein
MSWAEAQIHVTWALATAMASIFTKSWKDRRAEEIASDVADYIVARYGGEEMETIFKVLESLPIHVAERLKMKKEGGAERDVKREA